MHCCTSTAKWQNAGSRYNVQEKAAHHIFLFQLPNEEITQPTVYGLQWLVPQSFAENHFIIDQGCIIEQ